MTAQWLNTGGLVLGIAGVAILFKWGPPQPDLDPQIKIVIGREDEATKRLKRRYRTMSRLGLGLIGLAFGAQLIAVWR
jgi:hypothetical protein